MRKPNKRLIKKNIYIYRRFVYKTFYQNRVQNQYIDIDLIVLFCIRYNVYYYLRITIRYD
eukprot:snap_masked-scaffold_3-processed-gene-10.21-mRNA-1 protein AED:1.00 eAED:1.00 QI:0/0/0/0/1/1/2/0/59